MLTLDQSLPLGALIGQEGACLAQRLAADGAVWFSGAAESLRIEDGRITGWTARVGSALAEATVPNQGGTRFDEDRRAIWLTKGSHGGLALRGAAARAGSFTAAVIYSTPDDDARSLLAVNTGTANNLIFLSDALGEVTAKDRSGGIAAVLPAPRGVGPKLAMISLSPQGLFLRAGARTTMAQARVQGMDAPADLFIGCRSDRSGLVKTLGGARIHDVIFWSGRAVLAQTEPVDAARLDLLERYLRWTYPQVQP